MLTTRTYLGGKEGGTGCGVAAHVKAGEYLEVTTHDDIERLWIPVSDLNAYGKRFWDRGWPAVNVMVAAWGSTNMSPPPPRYGTFNVDI